MQISDCSGIAVREPHAIFIIEIEISPIYPGDDSVISRILLKPEYLWNIKVSFINYPGDKPLIPIGRGT